MKNISQRQPRRRVDVDTKPHATWSSLHSIHKLVYVGEDRLILRSTNFIRGLSLLFIALAAALFLGWSEIRVQDRVNEPQARTMIGGLLLLVGCALWLAPPRVVFDRRSGQIFRRYGLYRFRYSLDDVIAVQIVKGFRLRQKRRSYYQPRELNLVLDSSYAPRVNLTNHTNHATTRAMADEIAWFLNVPVWNEFEEEDAQQSLEDDLAHSEPPVPVAAAMLGWVALVCYASAFAAAFFCIGNYVDQRRLADLEASLRPVQARLVATEVKESGDDRNNWSAFGTFEIESGDYQGRADGSLVPQSHRRNSNEDVDISQAEAQEFLASWKVGKIYDGYVYPEYKDHIFFELPGEANARLVRRLRNWSGIFLACGLVTSICIAWLKRRAKRDAGSLLPSIPVRPKKPPPKPGK